MLLCVVLVLSYHIGSCAWRYVYFKIRWPGWSLASIIYILLSVVSKDTADDEGFVDQERGWICRGSCCYVPLCWICISLAIGMADCYYYYCKERRDDAGSRNASNNVAGRYEDTSQRPMSPTCSVRTPVKIFLWNSLSWLSLFQAFLYFVQTPDLYRAIPLPSIKKYG